MNDAQPPEWTSLESRILAALAICGFLLPNGVFIYTLLFNPDAVRAALGNPISLAFITEAFFLMFLGAWLLRRIRVGSPSGLMFIVMSLLGSLAFSVPAMLYLIFRAKVKPKNEPG